MSVLALFVFGADGLCAEQKFSALPLGRNLDAYASRVYIEVYSTATGLGPGVTFPYSFKLDGKLEKFAERKFREVADSLVVKEGHERDIYRWGISVWTDGIGGLLPKDVYGTGKLEALPIGGAPYPEPPYTEDPSLFYLVRGENGAFRVPEEVFSKVRMMDYGLGFWFHIPEVTDIEINLFGPGVEVVRFSTREQIAGFIDANCELGAITDLLKEGIARIPITVVTAPLSWWEYAEVTLLTPDKSVTFLVNRTEADGKAVRWSDPPPDFFVPPPPVIAGFIRAGDKTEVKVDATPFSMVEMEWSESLGGDWQKVAVFVNERGVAEIPHTNTANAGFYRLKAVKGQSAPKRTSPTGN